ncbi:ATPase [Sutcliffiella horikoshii]|uniref:ATPase n=2 Tax=Sutcliffiella horikoshii TaxID=79883 RepID=A0A5D4T359_9BACI|nr:ATPase [Sutcliffiella horikoshii]TYS69341.1 ATPase [Sutcliffiella horikoshii]
MKKSNNSRRVKMRKSFWVPLSIAFGSMVLLYLLGFLADINFLIFKVSSTYLEIAFLPICVGLILGVVSEQIIKHRTKSNI